MYRAHQDLLSWLALPGEPIPVAALIVVIAVTCLVTGRANGAVLAVVAVPVASVVAEHVLKPLVGRTAHGFLSYPSGHGTVMFALAAVLAVLMLNPSGRVLTPALRLIVPAAAVALACVISVIVIGVGVHYFTDTIAGAALGAGTVAATALVLDLPGPRRWLAAADGRLRKLHIRRSPGPRPAPGRQPERPWPPLAGLATASSCAAAGTHRPAPRHGAACPVVIAGWRAACRSRMVPGARPDRTAVGLAPAHAARRAGGYPGPGPWPAVRALSSRSTIATRSG